MTKHKGHGHCDNGLQFCAPASCICICPRCTGAKALRLSAGDSVPLKLSTVRREIRIRKVAGEDHDKVNVIVVPPGTKTLGVMRATGCRTHEDELLRLKGIKRLLEGQVRCG